MTFHPLPNFPFPKALQHSHVKLTWDEDDQDRVQMTRRKFTKEDLKEMDFRAYLASSEEDDSGDEDTEEMRRKYKGLLAGAEGGGFGKNREEDEGAEMEITFTPGLSEAAAEAVERKRKGGEMQEDVTTIEKYVRKLKEKKKAKKLAKKDGAEDEEDGEEGSHALFSDDDVSIDASDPFFADAKESSVATPAKAQSKC
ncbi:hypothetical protein BC936DRAFT_140060 [Jimgerdemannia flammicorona]|uniref:NUC153 domain-containing protein n=1 Tax=Jimgerdemannia flammicorona TaxID=994334 RepID=A0A433B491_9FUNG|nr:hypothetical protein BC936DRAFT_140060 [Jimgerdemannia flammicorona]